MTNDETVRTTISGALAASDGGVPLFLMRAWVDVSPEGRIRDIGVGGRPPDDVLADGTWTRCLIAAADGRSIADLCGGDADDAVRWVASALGSIPGGISGEDCAEGLRDAADRTTELLDVVEEVLADPDSLDLVAVGVPDGGCCVLPLPSFLGSMDESGAAARIIGRMRQRADGPQIPWAPMFIRVPPDAVGLPPDRALESGRWRIIDDDEATAAFEAGPDPSVWVGTVFSGDALRHRMAADAFGAVDDILSVLDEVVHIDGDPDGTNAFEADYDTVMDALDGLRESPAGSDLGFFLSGDGDSVAAAAVTAPFSAAAARAAARTEGDRSEER